MKWIDSKKATDNPYERFAQTELILRDELAIDRTILANERTFLAYIRTSMALVITGAGCIKLIQGNFALFIGIFLILCGGVVAVIGFERFMKMKRNISTARHLCKTEPRLNESKSSDIN